METSGFITVKTSVYIVETSVEEEIVDTAIHVKARAKESRHWMPLFFISSLIFNEIILLFLKD
jgi:hypothetical protein